MIGLATATQKSISHRDNLSLEIWAEYEAERLSKNREKRRAASRRRLEKAAKRPLNADNGERQPPDSPASSCVGSAPMRD